MPDPKALRAAERHLQRVDPVLGRQIARLGPCRLDEYQQARPLPALLGAIISQQLSVKAADTISRRFKALYGGRYPSAKRLLESDEDTLRSVGISRPKIRYMKDLAERVHARKLPLASLGRMDDEAVVDVLTQVKGIGRWTAQVFLMFKLGRLDVVAPDDLGLLEGARVVYGLEERPTPDDLELLAEPWRPYRTVGCWYLWDSRREAMGMERR